MRHVYSIVRYVPNVAGGERVNLGLLAGSDATARWALRIVGGQSRARRLGGGANGLSAVFDYLRRLSADIEAWSAHEAGRKPAATDLEECSEAWLRELVGRQRGIVQFSPPLPVDAESAESAISMLWPALIAEPAAGEIVAASPPAPGALTKKAATDSVRRAFGEAGIAGNYLWTGARIDAGGYGAPMDFVVHDGAAAFLAHCWSFRVRGKRRLLNDIQSWAWAVRSLRTGGGTLSLGGGGAVEAPKDIGLAVVYVPPDTADAEAGEAFATAMGAFGDPDVQAGPVVPYTEAGGIAGRALSALGAAGGAGRRADRGDARAAAGEGA